MEDQFDIAVIGAGPGGILASTLLQRRGHRVCVLERSKFPRFVIGESLLPSCMEHLENAGLIPHLEKQGYLVKGGVAILGGDNCAEFDFGDQFHEGWTYTWQVKRAEFDQAMVDGAEAQGVKVFFEHEVTAFEPGERPTLTWRTGDGTSETREFSFVIDASGYGRVLPRLLDLTVPSHLPARKTVFTHVKGDIRPAGAPGGFSWAICHEQGWLWVIPFADGTTSVGLVGLPEYFETLPDDPAECLRHVMAREPNLVKRMPEAEFLFPPKMISGYSANVRQLHGDGYCLVGNTGEFLDPIFSSGILFAFYSASRAVETLCRQLDGEPVDWTADYTEPLSEGIGVFADYVGWWYDGSLQNLFFSDSPAKIQQQICSVLAGYVWDRDNAFVADRKRKIPQLLRVLEQGLVP